MESALVMMESILIWASFVSAIEVRVQFSMERYVLGMDIVLVVVRME